MTSTHCPNCGHTIGTFTEIIEQSITRWIKESGLEGQRIFNGRNKYNQWAKEHQQTQVSAVVFGRAMKSLGWDSFSRSKSRDNYLFV